MTLRSAAVRLACICAALMSAAMPARSEVLDEEALRRLAAGNTIAGRYMFGGWFSEYHSADGRVFGNNGWQENEDACWTTRSNAICYSYGEAGDRQTYCFTVEKDGERLLLRNLSNGSLNAVGRIELSNPRNHGDGGKSWTCEDRTSSLQTRIEIPVQTDAAMKRTMRALLIPLLLLAALPARAELLSDEEINALFTRNTVTGRYLDGQFFTEYHDADGHAYGENRTIPNIDACWITQPGKVCYYYGPQEKRTLFCFTVEKNGETIVLTNARPNVNAGQINAFAKIEPGNPRHLTDNGKSWLCDGLISARRVPTLARLATPTR